MRGLSILLFLLLGCTSDDPPGYGATEVRLVNVGDVPLDSVVVRVTGAAYPVGTIAPGDSATVAAEPSGESGVRVELAGREEPLSLEVYFEAGYGGRVRAEVGADSVVTVSHELGY